MTEPNTLDEQIDAIMLENLGDTGWNGSLLSKQYQTAKQQLKTLFTEHSKQQNTPTRIMGKTIDEVCGILSMLDMERLAEMQLTMANLKKWQGLLVEEQKKVFEKSFARLKRNKGEDNE